MGKRLFLLVLFAMLMGISFSSENLMATDTFTPGGPEFHAVETVPLPEVKEPVTKAPAAGYIASVYKAPTNNIVIAGRTLEIVNVGDTSVNSGGHVNRYGSKFLYGHNTAGVLGGIVGLSEGSTFSVTNNGVTTNYQVAKVVIFEKNDGKLQIDGYGNYMNAVAGAVHLGIEYDLAVMTCYGTSYGNGDASHRFVLFANAI